MAKTAKQKLIDVALQKFSSQGFDGTSTREIVKEAGVNISSITYYFESKEGLYKACMNYISDIAREGLKENINDIIPLIKNNSLKQDEYRPIMFKLIKNAIAFICGDKLPLYIINLVIREQVCPSQSFNEIYQKTISPMHEAITFVFAKITNQNPKDKQVIMATHSIIGQIFIFRTHQEILKRRLDDITPTVKEITDIVLKHTNAILDSYNDNNGE